MGATLIHKISPNPSLPKRGIIPTFDKGRLGGILQINVVVSMRFFDNSFPPLWKSELA